jgi:hypothetical protein
LYLLATLELFFFVLILVEDVENSVFQYLKRIKPHRKASRDASNPKILLGPRGVELIKEAFSIRSQLLSGSDDSIEAMSARLGMNKFRLTSLVRLSYLAPGIIRALLADGIRSRSRRPASRG